MTTFKTLWARPRFIIAALTAMAALIATVLVFGSMGAGAGDFQAADFQSGLMVSGSTAESDDQILIAKVGEASITLAQLKEEILHMEQAKLMSQRQLDGLGEDAGGPTKLLQARQGVVTKWGTEVGALANLIRSNALVSAADAAGLSATDDQVAENAKYARNLYDNGEFDSYNQGYIKSVGEEEYWATVYPAKARAMLSIDNLHASVVAEGEEGNYRDAKTLWIAYEEATLSNAVIGIPESEHHSTSVEDVKGFWSDVRTVDTDNLEQDPDEIDRAPSDTWVV